MSKYASHTTTERVNASFQVVLLEGDFGIAPLSNSPV